MRTRGSIAFGVARDKRGIALPLALIGLICVTLMITAALLTSSTEAAISGAHKDAASDLYVAETGVQRYVATEFAQAAPFSFLPQPSTSTITVGSGSSARQVQVDVAEVLRMPSPGAPAGPSAYVSVAATPLDGGGRPRGRTISSLVRLTSTITQMDLQINSGLNLGGSAKITGNSEVVSKSTMCADTQTGDRAITHADGTTVDISGSAKVEGGVEKSTLDATEFRKYILQNKTLAEYAQNADIKFGPRYSKPDYKSSIKITATHPDTSSYNWGCPVGVGLTCPVGSTARFPMVAIDAGSLSGKTVQITGDYGQGILIVLGGHLEIQGNFTFKGIILVEGTLSIKGTAQGTAKIEGAVAAFNEVPTSKTNEISETSGNAVIRYNRCAVTEAQDAYNNKQLSNPQWQVPDQNPTFAWYELVR
jgi:hypothetical protein